MNLQECLSPPEWPKQIPDDMAEKWFFKTKSVRDAFLKNFGTHQDEYESFDAYLGEIIKLFNEHMKLDYLDPLSDELHRIWVENVHFVRPYEMGYGLDDPERALLRGNYEATIRCNIIYSIRVKPNAPLSTMKPIVEEQKQEEEENDDFEDFEEDFVFSFQSNEFNNQTQMYSVERHHIMIPNHLLCEIPVFIQSQICNMRSPFQNPSMYSKSYFNMPSYCVGGNLKVCPSEEYFLNNRPLSFRSDEVQIRSRFYDITKKYRTNNTLKVVNHKTRIRQNPNFEFPSRFLLEIPHEKPKRMVPITVLAMAFGWSVKQFISAVKYYLIGPIGDPNCRKCAMFLDILVSDRLGCETQKDALLKMGENFAKCKTQDKEEDILSYVAFNLHGEFIANLTEKNATDNFKRENLRKGDMLAQIAAELICQSDLVGKLEPHSMKSYQFKRVTTPGEMLAILMRKFIKTFAQKSKNRLKDAISNGKHLNLALILTRKNMQISKCVRNGDWDVKQSTSDANKNKTHIMTMGLCTDSAHMQTQKIVKTALRNNTSAAKLMICATLQGRIDPYTTPFSDKVGVVRFKSLGSVISPPINMEAQMILLQLLLIQQPGFHVLECEYPTQPWFAVYDLYGGLIGWIEEPRDMFQRFQSLRRKGCVPRYFNMEIDFQRNRFYFNCDEGRLLRPLIICSMIPELLKIFDNLEYLQNQVNYLLTNGFIEYLDVGEEFCGMVFVADSFDNAITSKLTHTHLEIHGIFSFTRTAAKCFANSNQGPRRIQTSNLENRSISLKLMPDRGTTDSLSLWYAQDPIMSDPADDSLGSRANEPNGYNLRVAIMSGDDMEDSFTLNRGIVDLGILSSEKQHFCTVSLTTNCKFAKPTPDVFGKGSEHQYRHLDKDGFLIIGSMVQNNDCIAGIVYEVKERCKVKRQRCRSEFLPWFRIFRVMNIEYFPNKQDARNIRITFIAMNHPMVGSKFYLAHGQKGTCGTVKSPEDMHFIDSGPDAGCTPDIIISSSSLMRVTIGLLLEIIFGTARILNPALIAQYETLFVAQKTMIGKLRVAGIIMKAHGMHENGKVRMRTGTTGELVEAMIFTGFAQVHVLNKMPIDKLRGRDYGPLVELTRQAPSTKMKLNAAQKMGQMEFENLLAYGASAMFINMNYHSADKFQNLFCLKCKELAIGHKSGFYVCNICKSQDSIVELQLPYISRLTCDEVFIAGVGHRYIV